MNEAKAIGTPATVSLPSRFDFSVFWARSGFQSAVTGPGDKPPVGPRPGFGDKTSAMNLAFAKGQLQMTYPTARALETATCRPSAQSRMF